MAHSSMSADSQEKGDVSVLVNIVITIIEKTLLAKHNSETTIKLVVEEGRGECIQKRDESRRKKRR